MPGCGRRLITAIMSAEVPNCSSRQLPITHPTAMREEISTTPERREIPFRRFYGCDIGDPFGLWGPNAKLAIEQIGNHGIAVIALGGPHSTTLTLYADPPLLHQTCDAEAIISSTLLLQFRMNAWTARDSPVGSE